MESWDFLISVGKRPGNHGFSVDDWMVKIFEDVGMRILDPQSGFCTKHVVGE
jgi:hypothetical protein